MSMHPKVIEWPLEWKTSTHPLVLNCPIVLCVRAIFNLQAQNITVQEAVRGAKLLVSHLKSLRTDAKYNSFYEQVICASQGLTSEPTIPHQRKLPKRLDDGANPHVYLTPKDRFRHKYFETLELTVGEIERRFNQEDIGLINSLESFLIDSANDNSTSMPDNLETYLKDTGFDLEKTQSAGANAP